MLNNLIVELDNAGIHQKGQKVLEGVNLRISRGEFTYLIGKTGSGKSSLLKTIYAALPMGEGRGKVAGFDLNAMNRKNIPFLRRKLGIIFQDFNLLSDRSVADNLLFVLKATDWKNKDKINTQIEKVLAYVGLEDKVDKMPHQLSGGEQQRLVIARALLNDPELIIADEPTGNLDPETSEEILLLLRKLADEKNTAILFATHDYRSLEKFPASIIRCVEGKVVSESDVRI